MSYSSKEYEVDILITIKEKTVVEAEDEDEAEDKALKEAYAIARFAGCNDYDVSIGDIEEL